MIYDVSRVSELQDVINEWSAGKHNGEFVIRDGDDTANVTLTNDIVYTGVRDNNGNEITEHLVRTHNSFCEDAELEWTQTYSVDLVPNLAYYMFGRPDLIPEEEYIFWHEAQC